MSHSRISTLLRASTLGVGALLASGAWAQEAAPTLEQRRGEVLRGDAARPLADARAGTADRAVAAVLRARGRDEASLAALHEAGRSQGRGGMQHVRFEQRTVDGLTVYGAYAKAAFDAQGNMVQLIDHLARVPAGSLPVARVEALAALQAAMASVHPGVRAEFRALGTVGDTSTFDGGAFFDQAPSVTAVAVPLNNGTMTRGWLVETWSKKTNQLHRTLVGGDGQVLEVQNRTAADSYNVFTIDPGKDAAIGRRRTGRRQRRIARRAGCRAQQKPIRINGNNADAYLDVDANNRARRAAARPTTRRTSSPSRT